MLSFMDFEIVVLGESFTAGRTLEGAWGVEEVDVLMKVDVVFLRGVGITLRAFIRLLSGVSVHVNADFSLVMEQFGTLRTMSSFGAFGRH